MAPRWWTLSAVCAATFMLLVDITIVQVALPRIQQDLHASLTDLQWVIDAYALALASLILICGSLSDRIGRQRIFILGVTVFTIASMMCGLSPTVGTLVAGRVLQGIGGAAMFATSLALIGQDFSGRERGTAIAVWSSTVGGAVAIGPLLGGLLTDGIGWQWIFFVNVPFGVAAVVVSATKTGNVGDPAAGRLDMAGVATLSSGMFLVIFTLLRGRAEGWTSALIVSCAVAGGVALALFVWVETRAVRAMFDLTLLRKPAFVGVSLATFAIGAGMFALFLFITLYLQDLLGYSALGGGVRMLPTTVLVFLVPLVSRRYASAAPHRLMLGAGLALVAVGLFWMHTIDTNSSWTALLPGMILTGIGIGLANPAIAQTALGVVAPNRSGMASGVNNTFRLSGVAVGIAVLGTIFATSLGNRLHDALPRANPHLADLVSAGGLRAVSRRGAAADPHTLAAVRTAFVGAFTEILLVGACIALAGAIAAVLLVRQQDFLAAAQAHAPVPGPPAPSPAAPR